MEGAFKGLWLAFAIFAFCSSIMNHLSFSSTLLSSWMIIIILIITRRWQLKYFLYSLRNLGEKMDPILTNTYVSFMGWFNHQPILTFQAPIRQPVSARRFMERIGSRWPCWPPFCLLGAGEWVATVEKMCMIFVHINILYRLDMQCNIVCM